MFNLFKRKKTSNPVNIVGGPTKRAEPYIIDYTTNCWGHSFVTDNRDTHEAHGFYESLSGRLLQNGDMVFHYTKDGIWLARVHSVRNCDDPKDMFFCKYTTITSMNELTEAEQKRLEELVERHEMEN